MKVTATARNLPTSPRKIMLVAALIRGQKAADAQRLLRVTNKRATNPIGKVLDSAIANAENNHNLRSRDLVVTEVMVGPAPTLKRMMPRARGTAYTIRHRTSHITITVEDQQITSAAPKKAVATTEGKEA